MTLALLLMSNYCKYVQILILNCMIQEITFYLEIWSKQERLMSCKYSQVNWG
jgi:hypothetical protein